MDPVIPLDFQRMFLGEEPPLYLVEILVRVVLIYSFSILALRYMGKRGIRQLTPFEYIVMIALGSATGDSMFYPEVPILYAWLVIAAMVLLDDFAARLQSRYGRFNTFIEGMPRMLIFDGKILENELQHERMQIGELLSQLREREIHDIGEIRYAFLEPSGQLGILRYEPGKRQRRQTTLPDCMIVGSKAEPGPRD